MDIIIVCHTEFGLVKNKEVVADKNATFGVEKGVRNLIQLVKRYSAKVTFAIMPEVIEYFPRGVEHEIGLHIHPGWQRFQKQKAEFYVGDSYLRKYCRQSSNSTVLVDYPYEEQLEMIRLGKEYVGNYFGVKLTTFVSGRWSINNDTVKALIELGLTHDCSAVPSSKPCHHNWSKLPRVCMPYYPDERDYQKEGKLPLLIVPISQTLLGGNLNIESVSLFGLSWLKACFLEYYNKNLPLLHFCLHSPAMIDSYFISAMENFLKFISRHKNINFKFVSEIKKYKEVSPIRSSNPYLFAVNSNIIRTGLKVIKSKFF